ncbi:autotransporter outer membrane beta-barrel domain-containing protein [Mycoplana dimorpha]|uniref:autotransporter outer membrane beta-barrel domain-containing protein n=1 Tax=Mycoplana dimorpha TaxID=28320 RepID=UPI0014761BAC|nr:autotransporter domain-containing protein [Mycoplana dimorpha]
MADPVWMTRASVLLALPVAVGIPLGEARASCVTSGNISAVQCASSDVQMVGGTGASSLTVTDVTASSVAVLTSPFASGPFVQTLTVDGRTVLNRTDYPGLYMYSSQAGWDANLFIGEDVSITSAGPFGAVWLRSESTDSTTSNDLVVNSSGTIVSYGANADGITATSNNGSVRVTNRGDVSAAGGRGIYAEGGYASNTPVPVSISNSGSIQAYQAGLRAINYTGTAVIGNDGSVRSATRQAIVGWSANGGATIDNSGTVVADHYDAILAAGTGGDVIVTNSGDVTANRDLNLTQISPDFHAISAYTSGAGSVTISNTAAGILTAHWDAGMAAASHSGTITMRNAGGIDAQTGIYAESHAGRIEIENSGTILSSGTGISVTAASSASIVNSGTIASELAALEVGYGILADVENSFGGLAIGAVRLGSAANLENAGTLVLKRGASLADYSGTGVATASSVDGNFVQKSTGRLDMSVDTASSYSTLTIGGTASLAGSLVLDVGAGYDGSLLSDVISTSGGLTSNGLAIIDNSLRYRFSALYDATTLDLVANDTGMTTIRAALENRMPGAAEVGAFWDDLSVSGTNSTEFSLMLQSILQAEREDEVASAVAETLPLVNGGVMSATFASLDRVNTVLRNRINTLSGLDRSISNLTTGSIGPATSGVPAASLAADALSIEQYVWLTTFAGLMHQDGTTGMSDTRTDGHGVVAGIDGTVGRKTDLGIAFAWSGSDLSTNNSGPDQGADVDTYQLALYGRHDLGSETGLLFQVDAGRSFVDGYRAIEAISATASSSYASNFAHVGLGLDRIFAVSEVTLFRPSVWVDYTWMKDDAYTETGANDLNLLVKGRDRDALVLGVNGALTHDLTERMAVDVSLGAGYGLLREAGSIDAAYAGSPDDVFTTTGGAESPWQVEAALALTYTNANGLGVTAGYDAWHRDDAFGQSAGLQVFKRF